MQQLGSSQEARFNLPQPREQRHSAYLKRSGDPRLHYPVPEGRTVLIVD
jgi:hypothetical protein